MDKFRFRLLSLLAFCSILALAGGAAADDSPCPVDLKYFQTLYINNGFDNWPYQEWVEGSKLYMTEGSGAEAECYYVGALWSSHPYAELQDPNYHWHASYSIIALQL
jgi:hypothetical protein